MHGSGAHCLHSRRQPPPSTSLPCRNFGGELADFQRLMNAVKRGDIVGVVGFPGKSKRGELSVFPRSLTVLAPCLHMPPGAHFGLKDQVGG